MIARLRPLLLPAIFALIVGALLVGLGVWQLHRLAWKEDLIWRIETRTRAPPQPLPAASTWARLQPADYDYRHVVFDGTFRHDEEALVFHGASEGPGYLVLAPLDLTSGGTIIVNRGFVPEHLKDRAARAASNPTGRVRVTGLMRPAERRNIFTPADEPAKNLFFVRDPQSIAAHLGLRGVAPFTVDADTMPNAATWPQGGTTELSLPNNHLSYALTWFGLALALLGVFASLAWRQLAKPDDQRAAGSRPAASVQ